MPGNKRNTDAPTSGNREESMEQSRDDQFGRKGAVRKTGESSTSSSGTVGLGGEDRNSESAAKTERES